MRRTKIAEVMALLVVFWAGMGRAALAAGAGASGRSGTGSMGTGIEGVVHFEGAHPKLKPILMNQDAYCMKVNQGATVYFQDEEVNSNNTLPNVFIYVESGLKNYHAQAPSAVVTLNQIKCMYAPHVLGIMVGQKLKVVSSDLTTHNIHAMPKNNRSWNQSQTPGAPPFTKVFTHTEIMVPVKCNQHPWMSAYIGVVSNPFYAVTGNRGTYSIEGLPPGHYTIGAWTAAFGTATEQVDVEAGRVATLDFTFHGR
ncbi:MAG TPA: carboxypeptidase regulatory-like domain-containing protein [Terriglobia bacterium]|nr:carboxypeptidase regulatory-like domain-containing protein [Terriglobia bacterium]